jgi:alpha-methylacyl-CoA racemase
MKNQYDRATWPAMRAAFETTFKSRPRDHWTNLLEGSDACFAPVLTSAEAVSHPHMSAREAFSGIDGVVQSAAAPRFSRTPGGVQGAGSKPGADTDAVLSDWGFEPGEIAALKKAGAIGG